MIAVMADIRLIIKTGQIIPFFPILQQGFGVPIEQSQTIRDILCEVYGLSPRLVGNKIQTLFLNGKPVDEMGAAVVKNGDTLALSAALPGLVGATMRAGGLLACFRNTITYQEIPDRISHPGGLLTIKLFNLLIKDLGPCFLNRGILISLQQMKDLFNRLAEESWQSCTGAEMNQQPLDPRELSLRDWSEGQGLVRLQVLFG